MRPYTFPAVVALMALGLITTGCQQTAPPQQQSSSAPTQPAQTQTETTTPAKSVDVTPNPNPADPDSSSKMVNKKKTTVKKQQ